MENQSPLSKEGIPSEFTILSAVPLETEESVNSSMPLGEVLSESKESHTPKSYFPAIENLENITGSPHQIRERNPARVTFGPEEVNLPLLFCFRQVGDREKPGGG